MNGRPWTRQLPPSVLPPFGPLEKISGRLDSFRSERFREYFDADAYRTTPLQGVSDVQRGAGAAMAIAAGSPGVGAVMMMEGDHTDTAEYIQGSINGKPFSGWVGQTRLQAGDEVEMAVEWQHDRYQVYAITLPEERIISICPKCNMGHIAHAWWRIKNMVILTSLLMTIIGFAFFVNFVGGDNPDYISFWESNGVILLMMLAGASFVSGGIAFSAYKAYAPTTCKLAEEIFLLFDMRRASKINLNKVTENKGLELKLRAEWHEPDDQ